MKFEEVLPDMRKGCIAECDGAYFIIKYSDGTAYTAANYGVLELDADEYFYENVIPVLDENWKIVGRVGGINNEV